jgi:hypothetical protein
VHPKCHRAMSTKTSRTCLGPRSQSRTSKTSQLITYLELRTSLEQIKGLSKVTQQARDGIRTHTVVAWASPCCPLHCHLHWQNSQMHLAWETWTSVHTADS